MATVVAELIAVAGVISPPATDEIVVFTVVGPISRGAGPISPPTQAEFEPSAAAPDTVHD